MIRVGKKRNGMSLVEVLMASLVLVLLLGGVGTSIVFALRLNYTNTQRFAAFALCKQKIEELQDLEFARVPTGMTLTGGKYVLVENNMTLSAQGYDGKSSITGTRRTEITDNRASATDPNFLATVSFTWQSRTKLSGGSTPTTHTISATSRIYPLQVDGEETYYTP